MSEENANDQRRDTRGFGAAAPQDRAGSAEQSAHHAAQGEVPAQEDASDTPDAAVGNADADTDAATGDEATHPDRPDSDADEDNAAPALSLEGLGVRGSKGWAFRDVDLQARTGDLVAVTGPSGSGRSALLLTIAGRMRPTAGSIEVAGIDLAAKQRRGPSLRRVRPKVALARLADQIGLDEDLTVAENTSDAADWAKCSRPQVEDDLDEWRRNTGLRLDPRTPVGELPALEATVLHLLLSVVTGAEVIALDDADANLTPEEREDFWRIAADVAATGVVVIATSTEVPPAQIHLRLHRHEVQSSRGAHAQSDSAPGPAEPIPAADHAEPASAEAAHSAPSRADSAPSPANSAPSPDTASSAVLPTPDEPEENGPQQ